MLNVLYIYWESEHNCYSVAVLESAEGDIISCV